MADILNNSIHLCISCSYDYPECPKIVKSCLEMEQETTIFAVAVATSHCGQKK